MRSVDSRPQTSAQPCSILYPLVSLSRLPARPTRACGGILGRQAGRQGAEGRRFFNSARLPGQRETRRAGSGWAGGLAGEGRRAARASSRQAARRKWVRRAGRRSFFLFWRVIVCRASARRARLRFARRDVSTRPWDDVAAWSGSGHVASACIIFPCHLRAHHLQQATSRTTRTAGRLYGSMMLPRGSAPTWRHAFKGPADGNGNGSALERAPTVCIRPAAVGTTCSPHTPPLVSAEEVSLPSPRHRPSCTS